MTLVFRFFCLLAALLCTTSRGIAQGEPYRPADTEEEFQRRYQERITKDRLNGVYIPKNLDDAINQLYQLTDETLRNRLRKIPEDSICIRTHARLGQWMIVHWSFYEGSRLSHYLRSAGITFPDDMADFLIIAFHRHLNQKPIEVRQLATYFKEKRRREWQERLQKSEVIYQEVRKRPPSDTSQTQPTVKPVQPTAKRESTAKGQ
ncbi:MAG: hypothetical protein NZM43_01690 [Saprospiraceae bacterium]|nr:hypothetical protein [Saprospiraceae bacterium]MDW8483013.1 DUF6794 domain-containing protein [Saprospiraceae bacterium]